MTTQLPAAFRGTRPTLLVLDVDGVLTTNQILLDGDQGEWKPFYVPDGLGLKLVQASGVEVALLSGRASTVVDRRARELGIEWNRSGVAEKGEAIEELLSVRGHERDQVVYVGDDLVDLPALRRVGLPVAVANACAEVRESACAVTSLEGGKGAVREVCEWILRARGDYESMLGRFTS